LNAQQKLLQQKLLLSRNYYFDGNRSKQFSSGQILQSCGTFSAIVPWQKPSPQLHLNILLHLR